MVVLNVKARAKAQRNVAVIYLRIIFDLAKKVKTDPDSLFVMLLANVGNLDSLWILFQVANTASLNCLT